MMDENLLMGVFGFLTAAELTTCACVCKRWKELSEDDYVWRFHVLLRWGIAAIGKNWKQIYRKRHIEELSRSLSFGPATLEQALRRAKVLKSDNRAYVSTNEGKELAKAIGAAQFFEISALLRTNVNEMFAAAIRTCITPVQKPNKKWYLKLLKK
eukprot:Phypoly_transcript_16730.p1 GENE.Phypoly_transcript_16730~~Phypoly_transcript_16730.p1  ORF type:complete len:155 (+),score=29.08 Phypoly_transcript_16730:319-783(+)